MLLQASYPGERIGTLLPKPSLPGSCFVKTALLQINERGKEVQIHHIDENNENSEDVNNLAALCFDCHNDTQIRGGFGRKLNAAQIIEYRDDWVRRVADIRRGADELLMQKQVGIIDAATMAQVGDWEPPSALELTAYIDSIPDTMRRAYALAQPEWDTGTNSSVMQATYQVIQSCRPFMDWINRVVPAEAFWQPGCEGIS